MPVVIVISDIKIGEGILEISERHEEFARVEVFQAYLLCKLICPRLRVLVPVARIVDEAV